MSGYRHLQNYEDQNLDGKMIPKKIKDYENK